MTAPQFIYQEETVEVKIEMCKKHITFTENCHDPDADYVKANRLE
jgi:hypothetical protein